MARIERDRTMILEIAIPRDTRFHSAQEMYAAVRDAAEEALVEALADAELQDYMELVMSETVGKDGENDDGFTPSNT